MVDGWDAFVVSFYRGAIGLLFLIVLIHEFGHTYLALPDLYGYPIRPENVLVRDAAALVDHLGLDDYDLDFSSPEPLGDIVTAEMRHRLRAELERLARLDDDEGAAGEGDPGAAPAKVAESEEQEQSADSEPDDDQPATA